MSVHDMFRRFFGFPNSRPQEDWAGEGTFEAPFPDDPFAMMNHVDRHFQEVFRSFGFPDFDTQRPFVEELPSSMPRQAIEEAPLRDKLLKPQKKHRRERDERLQDQDLDNQVSSHGLGSIIRAPSNNIPDYDGATGGFFSYSSSVSYNNINGKVEERRSKRDSSGNEETTVKRQLGDRAHSITTRKTRDGIQEQEENYMNMGEENLQDFNQKWNSRESRLGLPNTQQEQHLVPYQDPSSDRMFTRLFKNLRPGDK